MNNTLVYLSLPMKGREKKDILARIEEMRMKVHCLIPDAHTFSPYNVAEHYNLPDDSTYGEYLAHDIAFIIDHATHVFFARDWRRSTGCRLEYFTAQEFEKLTLFE